jgi:hypothetical protein
VKYAGQRDKGRAEERRTGDGPCAGDLNFKFAEL